MMRDPVKALFIASYVSSFLGARAGVNYDRFCAADMHAELVEEQPIEDAVFGAEEAYKLLLAQELVDSGE